MSNQACVDRGNSVRLVANFVYEPDQVFFSYMKPGSRKPIIDEGYGRPGSKITRIGFGCFLYVIDTTGFPAGKVEWHFWGEGIGKASRFGSFSINPAPVQLL